MNADHTEYVLADVLQERGRQNDRFGRQDHPDGTHVAFLEDLAVAREAYRMGFQAKQGTWLLILAEEFMEVASETNQEKLRAELVQLAAVACAWVECIDRRGG